MVELNFDRARPAAILDLGEVAELGGWSREDGMLRLGAGLTYAEIEHSELASELPALAEASRTVGSPQIRNRGTLGGNLGTASPAGDALPPLLVDEAQVELASAARGPRQMAVREFLLGPKRNALEEDELIVAVLVRPSGTPQTFMKVGPRNAMVIAVCSLAVAADRERGEIRASFGSARPGARLGARAAGRGAHPARGCGSGLLADRRRARNGRLSAPCARCSRRPRRREVSGGMRIEVVVNGGRLEADIWPGESLLFTLREHMGLPGSKNACEQGECGSCSVLLDGKLVCSCLVLAAQADGHEVVTVEGLADADGLHPVQAAFVEAGAVQCGFCTPGLVVAAADLIARTPGPSEDDIREALSGNICRCTGYQKIVDAVKLAAERT